MRDETEGTPGVPEEIDSIPAKLEADRTATSPGTGDHLATPRFRDLDERECRALLARNHVGRLAYSFRDRVGIEPVSYVLDADWLYGRTSPSEKLDVIRRSRWVAFQVDEIQGVFEWQSVVAHGGFYMLDPDGAPDELEAREKAVALLRRLIPETGTPADPVPHRNILFRIHVDRLEGRRATTTAVGEREVPLE